MSLRTILTYALVTFFCVAGVGVLAGAWASRERARTVEVFTHALQTERDLGQLDQCLQQLHRQVALLGQSFDASSGGALDPTIRGALARDYDACAEHGRAFETLASEAQGGRLAEDVAALINDWRFVTDNLGVHHVEALARQATEADPRSRRLLSERLPEVRRAQAERVLLAQRDFAEVSRRTDVGLATAVVGGLVALTLAAFTLARRLSRAFARLVEGAERFGAGDFEHTVRLGGSDEFGAVATAMNHMAAALREARGELTDRATVLEETIQRLEAAQASLVQQEKMAALGGLVAGVAHEVNTPLGVAVTAASFVRERFDALNTHAEAGTLTRGLVRSALSDAREALGLLLDNLARAADLIQSFKQVAVDRGQPSTRVAVISEWLHGVVSSLSPLARKHGVQIVVDAGGARRVMLAAGELEQVVTNLLVNACVHAYVESEAAADTRTVEVSVACEAEFVTLTVRDSGLGMPPEVASRVFEPFFTTRRGQGGSGLGLHIAHQIVTQRFGGTIALDTSPGAGSTWRVRLPAHTDALQYKDET